MVPVFPTVYIKLFDSCVSSSKLVLCCIVMFQLNETCVKHHLSCSLPRGKEISVDLRADVAGGWRELEQIDCAQMETYGGVITN
jgi:hypothetical protein